MQRITVFIYGMLAYAAFFITFLYLIGFVGNFVVPKSIDSGPAAPLAEALAINLALIGLFGLQHSIMARPWFKKRWTRIIPASVERSTFVMATCLVLALLYWQWRPMTQTIWEAEGAFVRLVLWALFWSGWALVLISSFVINHFDLFGLRQVYLNFQRRAYTHLPFSVSSLYRFVRHPLMSGFLIAMWATPSMTAGHLLFALGMTVYVLAAVRIEERDLVKFHGKAYQAYRSRVPMLLPSLRKKGRYTGAGEEVQHADT